MALIFGFLLFFVFYTYVGYPLILWGGSVLRQRRRPETAEDPTIEAKGVTVVIAAHNERFNLQRKLQSLRQQDYPEALIQIIIVSDGSTDGTCKVFKGEAGVQCLDVGRRQGKANALNFAMAQVTTPYVVFTDARQPLSPNAISDLYRELHKPQVGVVSGELVIRDETNPEQKNIGLYWRYEKWLRTLESEVSTTVGATGALYMMRASDYRPIPENTVLDDVQIPIQTLRQGKHIKFCPKAMAYDKPQPELFDERRRKLRTLAGNYQLFVQNAWLFNPSKNIAWWQFLSHKVFRLLVPYALIGLWGISFVLAFNSLLFTLAFFAQTAFYLAAAMAQFSPQWRQAKLCSFALVFVGLNIAAMQACWLYFSGGLKVTWQRGNG